tara:strand:+ start:18438 stop:20618 length:2181 start_codon:yes stop_codon:yes gene_type:complete
MNFYQAQDQARKQSRLLVALFILAVCFLVLITNTCVALFVLYSNPAYSLSGHIDPSLSANNILDWFGRLAYALGWQKSLWTTSLVCGVVFMAMGFKWLSLRQGGRVVAESLGGTLVLPSTGSVPEKRLLNVVEEIALASGTPVPQVYVLKNEGGINAFAAGLSPEDAVIGITQGALSHFNREQLQGVIAHEFSHILNGDMRLNMKLVAVLHGILMIAESGRLLMRLGSNNRRFMSSRRDNKAGGLFVVLGLCLWLIGLLGQLFGALIKAAVSRQREFLADASAVQFTRNPGGIADALSIIGGVSYQSKLEHHAAHELGHLFFSDANALEQSSLLFQPSKWQIFATHPPLSERIKRIQPKWSGRFLKQKINLEEANVYKTPDPVYPSFSDIQAKGSNQELSALTGVAASGDSEAHYLSEDDDYRFVEFEAIDERSALSSLAPDNNLNLQVDNDRQQAHVLAELMGLAHETYDASLMVIALLMSSQTLFKKQQTELIAQAYPKNAVARNTQIALLSEKLNKLNAKQTLEIVELIVPSLKSMSLKQYETEKLLLVRLIQVDGQVDIFEWLIFQLIKQNLDRHFGLSRPLKAHYKTLKSLSPLFEVVLSRVVHYGFEGMPENEIDEQDKRLAFIRACDVAGLKTINLLELDRCDGKSFSQAVHKLSLAYPLLKPRLIKGLLAAIHFDQDITDKERYVITAIAVVMDCPLIGLDIGLDDLGFDDNDASRID